MQSLKCLGSYRPVEEGLSLLSTQMRKVARLPLSSRQESLEAEVGREQAAARPLLFIHLTFFEWLFPQLPGFRANKTLCSLPVSRGTSAWNSKHWRPSLKGSGHFYVALIYVND